ncbi:hypothetical protein BS17DRAFT_775398 [Gyrodon lividus]|nr:hypothetical protein BS17DRAFT_775398 [Gyrodon lividus]
MPGPWICSYFINIAEIYGAQLYNTPLSHKKKRVQLTDFLTYHDDSYIWAWASDKEHRVSIRITKDAVEDYKRLHGRKLIDFRFAPVFISNFRPMFAPRPLGGNMKGNTPISYLSLEVGSVKLIGTGGHLFGNPLDLESDDKLKEWAAGLRQDGGGGNVLKLKKQEQNKEASAPPPLPPSFAPHSSPPPMPVQKVAEDVEEPKLQRPRDLKRAYDKRWRTFEVDRWKFATKPVVEEAPEEPEIGTALIPASPKHAPSTPRQINLSSPLPQQGTPSEWSPSHRGSPVPAEKPSILAVENEIENQDVLPIVSDPEDPAATADSFTALTHSETCSFQPPTPAQRIRRSPPSSPEPRSSQLIFSPPPPSSFLPVPSSSMPMPVIIRKNVKRKIPHPGIPPPRPDPNKPGPIQILVPNSDTSGTGSSQPHSQSQQSQSQSYAPAILSSLAKEFEPGNTSTPRDTKRGTSTRRTSRMLSGPSSIQGQVGGYDTTSADGLYAPRGCNVDTGIRKYEGSKSNIPPIPSASQIEALEVEQSGTGEDEDELGSTRLTQGDTGARTKDGEDIDATDGGHEETQLSDDDAEMHSILQSQSTPLSRSMPPYLSSADQPCFDKHKINGAPTDCPRRSPALSLEQSGFRSSMHSLFSDPLSGEQVLPLEASAVAATEPKEEVVAVQVPTHDPDAWKEPSFMSRDKEKSKARAVDEGLEASSQRVGKKRGLSIQPAFPAMKRAKVAATDDIQGERVPEESAPRERKTSGGMITGVLSQASAWLFGREPAAEQKIQRKNRHAATLLQETTETPTQSQGSQERGSKGRLANLLVDFEKVDLGKRVPMPRLDWKRDIQSVLLRTGRIRTLGVEVEGDGSIYINQE